MTDDDKLNAARSEAILNGELDFVDQGACRGSDANFWFPERGASAQHWTTIRRICGNCPVQEPCANWGINYERLGAWGGLSELQRNQYRKAGRRFLKVTAA